MKILFYINVLNNGGAERVMANLANELCKKHEIVLINSYKTENEYYLDSSINHLYLDKNNDENVVVKNIKRIRKIRKILKNEKPDVAISFMAEPNFRLIISKFFLPVNSIISIRNDPSKEYPNFIFKILAKYLYRLADGVVFQTEDAKKYFSKDIQNKSIIIYNPIKKIFYEQEKNVSRKGIVAVGRLTEQKNHRILIEAFSKVSDKINENLYIYGDGNLYGDLTALIECLNLNDRVFLMGNSSNIQELLPNYKLYVLSSDYEGMPNSLMEAMAIGLPCISTDCPCGGPKELLPIDSLTAVNDAQQMADKIFNLLKSPDKLEELARLNQIKSKEFKDINIVVKWEEYIKKVLNKI